jgi:hypothetical protein
MKTKILEKITELKEVATTNTENQQFDNGYNLATHSTIKFLTELLDDVDAKDAEIEMLRGKRSTPEMLGKRYTSITEMCLDR